MDDDDEGREIAAAHLRDCRAIVLTAPSAAQAWTLLQQQRVDVLLADIGMPAEDGYAFIRRVRALAPERGGLVPAAALTAFARDDDRRQALEAGFQLHLAKPVDAAALISAVARLGRGAGRVTHAEPTDGKTAENVPGGPPVSLSRGKGRAIFRAS